MIDHTGFYVSDLESSKAFYTSVLASLGYALRLEFAGKAAGFGPETLEEGTDPGGGFWITKGTPYTPRVHLAFQAVDHSAVPRFYDAALEAGGKDNGEPGERHYHPGYYAAFVLDPDGNNIEAVFHGPVIQNVESVVLRPDG